MILGVAWTSVMLASLAMALGGLIQASVGLGFALAAIPLIALVETAFIPGPIMMAGMFLVVVIAWRGAARIDRAEIGFGFGGLVAGTAIGAFGLWLVPPDSARLVFGILILVAVLISAFAPPLLLTRRNLVFAGTASGIVGTMVGMHGPPLGLVYQGQEPWRARLMLSAFFVPAVAISLAALALLGRFGLRELGLGLLLVPGALVGLAAAPLAAPHMDRRRTRYAILAIAGISGALLLF